MISVDGARSSPDTPCCLGHSPCPLHLSPAASSCHQSAKSFLTSSAYANCLTFAGILPALQHSSCQIRLLCQLHLSLTAHTSRPSTQQYLPALLPAAAHEFPAPPTNSCQVRSTPQRPHLACRARPQEPVLPVRAHHNLNVGHLRLVARDQGQLVQLAVAVWHVEGVGRELICCRAGPQLTLSTFANSGLGPEGIALQYRVEGMYACRRRP